MILTRVSIFHAFGLAEDRNTVIVLVDAIVDAQLIFSLTVITIAISGAIISFQEAILLSHYWHTALINIYALILANLTEAFSRLPYAFDPPEETIFLTDHRNAIIILIDAVIDSQLIIWCAFLIACC